MPREKKLNNYSYFSQVKNKVLLKITLTINGTPFSFLQNRKIASGHLYS